MLSTRTVLVVAALASPLALSAPPSGVEARFIFPAQPKHVHSSSIVETPGGDLLACWYHGSGERTANDVKVLGARLVRGEPAWSEPFLLADTPGLPDCNPVLFVDRKKRLWLFWIVVNANRWEHSLLKYRRAERFDAAGEPVWSWQDVISLVPGDEFATVVERGFEAMRLDESLWAEYAPRYSKMLIDAAADKAKRQRGWMPRTHPLTLPGGRILLPLYSDGFNLSLMAVSDDDGDSWRAGRPIVGLGPIQPTVVRRDDGTLVAYMRDSGGAPARVLRSESNDDGISWSTAADTEIPNPGSSLEVIRLAGGRWAMVYNDTERGRHSLALALSDDEGTTWKRRRRLEEAPPRMGSFSYPSLIQSRDGRLHLTYSHSTRAGETIRHAALDVEWIEGE